MCPGFDGSVLWLLVSDTRRSERDGGRSRQPGDRQRIHRSRAAGGSGRRGRAGLPRRAATAASAQHAASASIRPEAPRTGRNLPALPSARPSTLCLRGRTQRTRVRCPPAPQLLPRVPTTWANTFHRVGGRAASPCRRESEHFEGCSIPGTERATSGAGIARRDMSGGPLVHEATHHFDLANWRLDDVSATVRPSGCSRSRCRGGRRGRSGRWCGRDGSRLRHRRAR